MTHHQPQNRYTVSQLAALSGVSVRALHHYDEMGLLKPAFIGSNGYRYYGREELLRLPGRGGFLNMSEIYAENPVVRARFDRRVPGLADYVVRAMRIFCVETQPWPGPTSVAVASDSEGAVTRVITMVMRAGGAKLLAA